MTVPLTFYDAAYPPAVPPKADGVCFYIGGDTPHVWSLAEIEATKVRYRLPIYTRSDPQNANPVADGDAAIARLKEIGAPRGILVALDIETAIDASYVYAFYGMLYNAGYKLIVYGSQSTVLGNDNPDGLYWGAEWSGVPHIAIHDAMTQYVSFNAYDESLAEPSLPFWDTEVSQIPSPGKITATLTGKVTDMTPACIELDGTLYMYYVGTNKACYRVTPGKPPVSLGGQFISGLAACASQEGMITVCGTGLDGNLWYASMTADATAADWRKATG